MNIIILWHLVSRARQPKSLQNAGLQNSPKYGIIGVAFPPGNDNLKMTHCDHAKMTHPCGPHDNNIPVFPYSFSVPEAHHGKFNPEYNSTSKPVYRGARSSITYYTGMRAGEILSLTWQHVNIFGKKITLDPGTTKNDEAKIIYFSSDLYEDIIKLKILYDSQFRDCTYVFNHNGKRIKDFRGAWKTACSKTGIDGKLFDDLRRTGVKNSPNIVNEDDLKSACQRIAEHHEARKKAMMESGAGAIPGTISIIKK